jgi:hypothetical protein
MSVGQTLKSRQRAGDRKKRPGARCRMEGDWQAQARRLLDLLMDGLRAGAQTTPVHDDRT